jgi:hypothetical protein
MELLIEGTLPFEPAYNTGLPDCQRYGLPLPLGFLLPAVFIGPRFVIEDFNIFFVFREIELVSQLFSHVLFRHFSPFSKPGTRIIQALPAMLDSARGRAFLIMTSLMNYPEANGAAWAAGTMNVPGRQFKTKVFFPGCAQVLSVVELFIVGLEGSADVA